MKRLMLVLGVLMMALVFTASAPITAPPPAPIPATATPAPEPEMPTFEGPLAEIANNVRAFAGAETGADPDAISIVEIEAVDWPDGCLGAATAEEMCIQMITPGYRVVVDIDGVAYIYHTNDSASHIRPAPDSDPGDDRSGADAPGTDIAMAVRQMLMQQLHADFDAIAIVAIEAVDWPDACLGAPGPEEMCAQMITPGYRIVLEVDGEEYIYHTDAGGQSIRQAGGPEAITGAPVVVWTFSDDYCRTATIGHAGVAFGRCYGRQMQGYLAGEARLADLDLLAATFAPFTAETRAGHVEFVGSGTTAPTPAQARMIAEWARLVALEAEAGRSGASWGLAFAWDREGGISGHCDHLAVYVTGHVFASQCRGEGYTTLGMARLNAGQLDQLFAWIDAFGAFEVIQTDTAQADGMTVSLVFSGAGAEWADPVTQAAIADFGALLFESLQ